MFWPWVLSLSSLAYCHALTIPETSQTPLDISELYADGAYDLSDIRTDDKTIIRRYALHHSDDWNIDDVYCAAEFVGAEVLNEGPSHVDILFQDQDQKLDIPLPGAGSIPFTGPEDFAYLLDGWNLSSLANTTYHTLYHPLYEVEDFMEELETAYPGLVSIVNLGHSAEGREMLAIKISKDSAPPENKKGRNPSSVKKTAFMITGAQHAREWIATSTTLYLAHTLVADASDEYSLSSWLDHFDFHIIPVPNPDGYTYTWEHDRLWYKNRQNIGPAERCTGIDMNRNWGYKWNARSRLPAIANATTDEHALFKPGKGADADPCSTWYPGHRPFEAPEVNNIANYVTTIPSLKAFIDLRSYGQMLSIPYSFSCKKTPKDAEDQLEAALGAVNAIKQVHGTHFTTGSLCEQLYKASGNVVDYMYARAGVKYAYSVHLRDTGTYGFSLPAEWIRPVGEETANMVRFLANFIFKKQNM